MGAQMAHSNINPPLPYGSGMPPPPPLDSNPTASQAATDNALPAKAKVKKTRASHIGSVGASAEDTEEGEGSLNGATAPKRRGRPPGSKNKKPKLKA